MGRTPGTPEPRFARSTRTLRRVALPAITLSVFASVYLANPIPATVTVLAWIGLELYLRVRNAHVERIVKSHSGFTCTTCGYDLRRSPAAGCCPECGVAYTHAETWRTWRRWMSHAKPPARKNPPYSARFRWASVLSMACLPVAILLGAALGSHILLAVLFFLSLLPLWFVGWRTGRVMEAAHAANFMLCTHCAYDMSAYTVGRCPECGRPFDQVAAQACWRDWCTRR